jgi:hypothetical protein
MCGNASKCVFVGLKLSWWVFECPNPKCHYMVWECVKSYKLPYNSLFMSIGIRFHFAMQACSNNICSILKTSNFYLGIQGFLCSKNMAFIVLQVVVQLEVGINNNGKHTN